MLRRVAFDYSRCIVKSTVSNISLPLFKFSNTGAACITRHGFFSPLCCTNARVLDFLALRNLSSSSFSNLPPEEEEAEKNRLLFLTPYEKEMELRRLDSEIARLQTLRAINTGELYTWRGKFKMLSRDYGIGFMVWYWTVWCATGGMSYIAIQYGAVDPIVFLSKIETFFGWEIGSFSRNIDPTVGQIGLAVAVNECLEPLRLPFVVLTTKPVVKAFTKQT